MPLATIDLVVYTTTLNDVIYAIGFALGVLIPLVLALTAGLLLMRISDRVIRRFLKV